MMKLTIKEIAVFGMFGGVMYASKLLMEFLPNVHLLGAFIVALTIVYRWKALYPIYVFVFLTGLFNGFSMWWIPYLYIWLPLFFVALLLPQKLPIKWAPIIYCSISALHGFLYGVLYAPFQAIWMGLNFEKTLAWIISGFPWDIIHGISNFVCGLLIIPLIKAFKMCEKNVSS